MLFLTIKNIELGGDQLAKSHYSIKKRKKELARKLKQEQKRQRKFEKDTKKPEDDFDKSHDEVKIQQP